MPSNKHLRVQPLESLHGLLRDLRGATKEKDSVTLFRRPIDQHWYKISACDALRKRITEKPGGPDERRSIAEDEVRLDKDSVQLNVFERLNTEVDIGRNHIMRVAAGHHIVDAVEGFSNGQIVKGNAQQRRGQVCRRMLFSTPALLGGAGGAYSETMPGAVTCSLVHTEASETHSRRCVK